MTSTLSMLLLWLKCVVTMRRVFQKIMKSKSRFRKFCLISFQVVLAGNVLKVRLTGSSVIVVRLCDAALN